MRTIPIALIAIASAMPMRTCNFGFGTGTGVPSPGSHQLGIAFQHQQGQFFCAIANVSMWVKFKGSPYPSN